MKRYIMYFSFAAMLTACGGGNRNNNESEEAYTPAAPEFCADSAYNYIAEQCAFGPRVMNSEAHDKCGDYLQRKFEEMGCIVTSQHADLEMYDGTKIKARNIIATAGADAPVRIIIASHWDSRPWADHDADEANHKTPIDGANDGASGVGVMLEIARQMKLHCPSVGIDFICFDAEDCGTPEWDERGEDSSLSWCLGSQYWSSQIQTAYARYGILLDMVGGSNCVFTKEGYSVRYADEVVGKIWSTAAKLGYSDLFRNEYGGYVTDDHIQVIKVGIPCADIISSDIDGNGFNVTWHTVQDDMMHINKETLRQVGQTVMETIWTTE